MVKRAGKMLFVFTLFVVSIFLVSCSNVAGGNTPVDTATALKQAHTGTQGIEIQLLPNYPAAMIYDTNELIALLEVRNKGADDISMSDCFIQVTGFDPNIIRGGFDIAVPCTGLMQGTLEGKNVYNPQGGINQIEFRSSDIKLPDGIFEYNPVLNFVTCYNYHTIASPLVCLDPLFYQDVNIQKTCTPKAVSLSGGQGGPVGVSYVNAQMMGGKATFEINIQNMGGGKVFSPNSGVSDCAKSSIERSKMDLVRYKVEMSNGVPLSCKPIGEEVRLAANSGKIICTATVPGTAAYETPLKIDLDYNYMTSFTKAIKIVGTPQ
jgi:hypothetical protein